MCRPTGVELVFLHALRMQFEVLLSAPLRIYFRDMGTRAQTHL